MLLLSDNCITTDNLVLYMVIPLTIQKKNRNPMINYTVIGYIHSPFTDPKGTPIQTPAAQGVKGTVEILPEYAAGLKDIEGFSHIILLYHCHLSQSGSMLIKPYLDDNERGVFATRAPRHPNPIGLSVVRLISIDNNILHIQDIDIIDNTPLLDIKPYVPQFDNRKPSRIGWLEHRVHNLHSVTDDGRFTS